MSTMQTITLNCTLAAASALLVFVSPAIAGYTVTQSSNAAPTYNQLLTFDEPGTPTGAVSSDHYASLGLTMSSGVDASSFFIGDVSAGLPWVGAGNVAGGGFGLFLEFSPGTTAVSFQAWGDAGNPGPFGGGIWIWVLDGDGNVLSDFDVFEPAWGGLGDTWYNVTASDGDTIQYLLTNNNSMIGSETFIDNLSWQTAIPAPGALALFGVAGLVGVRRRRS